MDIASLCVPMTGRARTTCSNLFDATRNSVTLFNVAKHRQYSAASLALHCADWFVASVCICANRPITLCRRGNFLWRLICEHYRKLVKPKEAERYRNLQPVTKVKVVPLVTHA
jgi:hypothetical protein